VHVGRLVQHVALALAENPANTEARVKFGPWRERLADIAWTSTLNGPGKVSTEVLRVGLGALYALTQVPGDPPPQLWGLDLTRRIVQGCVDHYRSIVDDRLSAGRLGRLLEELRLGEEPEDERLGLLMYNTAFLALIRHKEDVGTVANCLQGISKLKIRNETLRDDIGKRIWLFTNYVSQPTVLIPLLGLLKRLLTANIISDETFPCGALGIALIDWLQQQGEKNWAVSALVLLVLKEIIQSASNIRESLLRRGAVGTISHVMALSIQDSDVFRDCCYSLAALLFKIPERLLDPQSVCSLLEIIQRSLKDYRNLDELSMRACLTLAWSLCRYHVDTQRTARSLGLVDAIIVLLQDHKAQGEETTRYVVAVFSVAMQFAPAAFFERAATLGVADVLSSIILTYESEACREEAFEAARLQGFDEELSRRTFIDAGVLEICLDMEEHENRFIVLKALQLASVLLFQSLEAAERLERRQHLPVLINIISKYEDDPQVLSTSLTLLVNLFLSNKKMAAQFVETDALVGIVENFRSSEFDDVQDAGFRLLAAIASTNYESVQWIGHHQTLSFTLSKMEEKPSTAILASCLRIIVHFCCGDDEYKVAANEKGAISLIVAALSDNLTNVEVQRDGWMAVAHMCAGVDDNIRDFHREGTLDLLLQSMDVNFEVDSVVLSCIEALLALFPTRLVTLGIEDRKDVYRRLSVAYEWRPPDPKLNFYLDLALSRFRPGPKQLEHATSLPSNNQWKLLRSRMSSRFRPGPKQLEHVTSLPSNDRWKLLRSRMASMLTLTQSTPATSVGSSSNPT